jgi:hypothetical protein
VLGELVLAGFNAGTALRALDGGCWAIAFFAALFAAGLALVAGLTIAEAMRGAWARRDDQERVVASFEPRQVVADD